MSFKLVSIFFENGQEILNQIKEWNIIRFLTNDFLSGFKLATKQKNPKETQRKSALSDLFSSSHLFCEGTSRERKQVRTESGG